MMVYRKFYVFNVDDKRLSHQLNYADHGWTTLNCKGFMLSHASLRIALMFKII